MATSITTLETLTTTLSTLQGLPTQESLLPATDGLSLLDTKNELLLSYLQNLVFVILIKIRNAKARINIEGEGEGAVEQDGFATTQDLTTFDQAVKRLVELRLYLERGVKPLENKLRYQIDRAVRAAEEQEEKGRAGREKNGRKLNGNRASLRASHKDLSGDSSDGSSKDLSGESEGSSSETETEAPSRPNLSSFVRPSITTSTAKNNPSSSGVYKPPRVSATSMPLPSSSQTSKAPRPRKSNLLDEYVSTEFSSAPIAEPSIGTNIVDRGRRDVLSARERNVAAERQRYEEENLVRLPGMGKKEKRDLARDRERRGQFGGEEWRGLGGDAERISGLLGRRKVGVLERARKRGRDGESGGRELGVAFEKRRRMLERRKKG